MKIVAHFKKGNARVSITKVKRSVLVSIADEAKVFSNTDVILSLPGRLVKDQLQAAEKFSDFGYSRLEIEAEVMKHMPSNFLSYLHGHQLNVLAVLEIMLEAIDGFEKENVL